MFQNVGANQSPWTLFAEHLRSVLNVFEKELPERGFDALIVGAGEPTYFYDDDQVRSFRSEAPFRYICPATGPGHLLIYRPGDRPQLILYRPIDYWHAPEPEPSEEWASQFDLKIANSHQEVWAHTLSLRGVVAYIGSQIERAHCQGFVSNPFLVMSLFNWMRSFKSPYEVVCIEEANQIAAAGHEAARLAFQEGKSEFLIHLSFLQATQQLERDLAYESIVALGSHAAILHYQNKSLAPQEKGPGVLLIDAGVTVRGYHSDVTRTWLKNREDSKEARVFASLLCAIDELQKRLCESVRPGLSFGDLHFAMQKGVAEILLSHGLVRDFLPDSEEGLAVARHFIPHGVGHLLGIFVHDVGGKQANSLGQVLVKEAAPHLRSLRTLAAGMVLTIEPGLYFIPEKLKELNQNFNLSQKVNWDLAEKLKAFGGIRIEDNILVTETNGRNLTRPHSFPAWNHPDQL